MKKGISLVSLTIVIVIMAILAGVVVITAFSSAEATTLNTFAVEILNIQNAVDEYKLRYDKYPSSIEIEFDLTKISDKDRKQFDNETIQNSSITFNFIDVSLIGIKDTEFGNGKVTNDIYVLSETTGRVYYLEGVEYEEDVYYTLTDELYSIINATSNVQVTSKDVKVYDVIFTPSKLETTNHPITVLVRIPKNAIVNSIVTTGDKSVGQETVVGMYKQFEINTTSEDKTGNYNIIVNYTHNNKTKTAEYNVSNFDGTLPTISYTEKIEGDLKEVNFTVNNNGSTIRTIKYEQEIISNIAYFKNYGRVATNNQFVVGKDDYFTIYVETTAGTIVTLNNMPEDWKENVIDIVDGVPIPKGFTASPYNDENKKDDGLVIYELAENEVEIPRSETQFKSWTERNQYVWVPVDDFSKFVRTTFGMGGIISNKLGTGSWEIELDPTTNMPLEEQDENFVSSKKHIESQSLYSSVKKYGGFYVARYEAGVASVNDKGNMKANIYSAMGKIPCTGFVWGNSAADDTGGVVEIARSVYPASNSNFGVVSTLIYGVQWDSTLQWWLDTAAVSTVTSSVDYGNYLPHVINKGDLNEGARYSVKGDNTFYEVGDKTKDGSTGWLLTTGALKAAKVNNIYDMAGNEYEWTMEGNNETRYNVRGRDYYGEDDYNYVSVRGLGDPAVKYYSFRVALYIK